MSEEHEEGPAWLAITADDGHEFTFASQDQALKYIEQEAGKWRWMYDEARQHSNVNFQPLQEFAGRVSGLNPQRPKADDPGAVDSWLRARVRTYLSFVPAIHDRSTLQPFLLDIRDRDQQEAFWTLLWLMYRRGRIPSLMRQQQRGEPFVTAGMTNAWLWEQPVGQAVIPDLLDKLAQDAGASTDTIAVLRQQANDDAEAMRALVEASESHRTDTIRQLEEATTRRLEELQELYASKAEQLDESWKSLHRTYDEQLALKAPSKYWAEKQESHRKRAQSFGLVLVIFAIASVCIVASLSFAVFGGVQINAVPRWSQAITMTAVLVLVIWTLKTLVRLTLSHAHLEIDANERRIMILSYLAMLKKADATEGQRTALFTAIFRPTGNGLVPDESPPVPLLELLKK